MKYQFQLASAATAVSFAILVGLGWLMEAAGATNFLALQAESTAAGMRLVAEAWRASGVAHLAAFGLGFDYAFMLAYAVAFYLGADAARSAYAPQPGRLSTVLRIVSWLALAAASFDVVENALELWIAFGTGLDPLADALAPIAYSVTLAKWLCIAVSVCGWLAGLVALATGRFRPAA